jgi:hypothetical protein
VIEQIDQRCVGKQLVILQSMAPDYGLPTEAGPAVFGQTNPKCRHLGASNSDYQSEYSDFPLAQSVRHRT